MTMHVSPKGRQFIFGEEGNPKTAYLDIGGVVTVGPGLSNNSKTVVKILGKLKRGQKYSDAELDRAFAAVLASETEPAVLKGLPGSSQEEFDGAASGTYNLGPAYPSWQWAKLWRAGKKHAAFDYVRTHYNTVKGKKVTGLVNRRKREADLMEFGRYGAGVTEGTPRAAMAEQPAAPDPMVREAQKILTDRGFDPGAVDGWMGPKTKSAIEAYQKFHPDLTDDGILGPATMTQLRRDAATVTSAVKSASGSGVAAAAATYSIGFRWDWIAVAVAVVIVIAVLYTLWKYRDAISRRWHTITGKEQTT